MERQRSVAPSDSLVLVAFTHHLIRNCRRSTIHPRDVEDFMWNVGVFFQKFSKDSLRFVPRSLDWVKFEGGSNDHTFERGILVMPC